MKSVRKTSVRTLATMIALGILLGGAWISATASPDLPNLETPASPPTPGTSSPNAPLQPDLVILDLSLSPDPPQVGDGVVFQATVKNQGNASAGNSTLRFLLDEGQNLGDVAVPGLLPGATANVSSHDWTATPGDHTIRATADVLNQVNESNEANNERERAFHVEEEGTSSFGVDLSPENQNGTVLPRGNISYTISVTNTGSQGDTIRFSRTDPPPGWNATLSQEEVTLNPGETSSIRLALVAPLLPLGGLWLSAIVDVTGESQGDPNASDTVRTETRILV